MTDNLDHDVVRQRVEKRTRNRLLVFLPLQFVLLLMVTSAVANQRVHLSLFLPWLVVMIIHLLWVFDVWSFAPWTYLINRATSKEIEREQKRQEFLAQSTKIKRDRVIRLSDEGELIEVDEYESAAEKHNQMTK